MIPPRVQVFWDDTLSEDLLSNTGISYKKQVISGEGYVDKNVVFFICMGFLTYCEVCGIKRRILEGQSDLSTTVRWD